MSTAPSSPRWLELRFEVPRELAEDFAGLVCAAGAQGLQTIDPEDELPRIEEPLPAPDVPVPSPTRAGHALLIASYTEAAEHDAIESVLEVATALSLPLDAGDIDVAWRDDTGWTEKWKEYFEPLRFGERIWVVPTWRTEFTPPAGAIVLTLDPGMAFGTGQHATTALCLEILESQLGRPTVAGTLLSVADIGCGSGVLAIAAAKLGARRVVAVDNDPIAVRVTAENCAANGVAAVIRSSETPAGQLRERFDCVLANILAVTLIELADDLVALLAPKGQLVLSGVLATQRLDVETAMRAAAQRQGRSDFVLHEVRQRGDWVAMRMG